MNKIIFFFIFAIFSTYSFAGQEVAEDAIDHLSIEHVSLAVQDIEDDGLVLMLNDGSQWDIKFFGGLWRLLGWGWIEQKNVSHWVVGDEIGILYPGSGNFFDFVLVIANFSRNERALAVLKIPPSIDYPACLWVADLDKETNTVTLNDGTSWLKSDLDMYGALFYHTPVIGVEWMVGDVITKVGNEGCFLDKHISYLWNHSVTQMLGSKRLR